MTQKFEELKPEYLRKDIFAHNVDTRGPAQEQTAHVFGKLHECKLRDSIPVTYKRSLNCCNMKKKFSNIYWELVGTLWLPQVLNQGLSHQCTCFSYIRGGSTDLGLYLWGNWTLPTVQGSISLEYQTCTSPHPFDTLVTGMFYVCPSATISFWSLL